MKSKRLYGLNQIIMTVEQPTNCSLKDYQGSAPKESQSSMFKCPNLLHKKTYNCLVKKKKKKAGGWGNNFYISHQVKIYKATRGGLGVCFSEWQLHYSALLPNFTSQLWIKTQLWWMFIINQTSIKIKRQKKAPTFSLRAHHQ